MRNVYISAEELREMPLPEVFARLGARWPVEEMDGPRTRSLGGGDHTVSLRKSPGALASELFQSMTTLVKARPKLELVTMLVECSDELG